MLIFCTKKKVNSFVVIAGRHDQFHAHTSDNSFQKQEKLTCHPMSDPIDDPLGSHYTLSAVVRWERANITITQLS